VWQLLELVAVVKLIFLYPLFYQNISFDVMDLMGFVVSCKIVSISFL
jgi:hypothetical protein